MKYLTMSRHMAVASFVAASLALSACGGGGGDDTTATVESELAKARGEASRLAREAGDPGDMADENGSLHAQINYHSGEASRLRTEAGDASDAPDAMGSLNAQINYHEMVAGESSDDPDAMGSLHAQINYHMKKAGNPGDAADEMGSLYAQINYHSGEVRRLDGLLGDATDAADDSPTASLHAQLNAAKGMIGSSTDTAEPDEDGNFPEGTSLYAMINYHTMKAGNPGDAADEMGSLYAQIAYHRDEAKRLDGLLGDATDAADSSPTASLHAQLNAAKGMIGSSTDMAEPDEDGNFPEGTSLYAMINYYRAKEQKAVDDAAKAAADARVKSIAMALDVHKVGQPATSSPLTGDGSTSPAVTGTHPAYTISAERSSDGSMITVTIDTGDDGEADTAAADDLVKGTGASGDPWNSVLATDGTEEWMVVTDIATPKQRLLQQDMGGEEFLAVDPSAEGILARIMLNHGLADGTQTRTVSYEQNGTVTGTWRGIDGTYTCVGATGCTVTVNAEEQLQSILGNLQFRPSVAAATYPVQDTDYLYFGWWLDNPDSAHSFEAFSDAVGTDAATVREEVIANQVALDGTASYSGMATGKYVTKTFTAGVFQSGNVGPFMADVSLTATFDANDDGTADATDNMINGTVDNFRDVSGGSLGSWTVTLADTAFAGTGSTNVNLGGATEEGAGMWTHSFHYGATTEAPGAVIGEFDAHAAGGVAHIYGAYGATKGDE